MRGAAAFALGQIGAEPESTVRLLTGMLKHPDQEVWASSASGLGRMGAKATPAIPALVEALANNDRPSSLVRGMFPEQTAAAALRNIGEPAIPALVEALQSKRTAVRQRSADALLWMHTKRPALGALVKAATEDDDQEVRVLATRALTFPPGCDTDETLVVPALLRIVKDKSPVVRGAGRAGVGRPKALRGRVVASAGRPLYRPRREGATSGGRCILLLAFGQGGRARFGGSRERSG